MTIVPMSKDIATPILVCNITCPECGGITEEMMATDACQWFYQCPKCEEMLKPNPGDCCVFCSFGSVECPPRQTGDSCCE